MFLNRVLIKKTLSKYICLIDLRAMDLLKPTYVLWLGISFLFQQYFEAECKSRFAISISFYGWTTETIIH